MNPSLREILDRQDELADRFEAFDPAMALEVPVAEYLLQRAARELDSNDPRLADAVMSSRNAGTSWERIAQILNSTADETERRFATPAQQLGSHKEQGPGADPGVTAADLSASESLARESEVA